MREHLHFRENAGRNYFLKEFFRSPIESVGRNAIMHGHHLAAHIVFADQSSPILAVALPHGFGNLFTDESTFHFPIEELLSRIGLPQSAIAIENGERGFEIQDRLNELFGSG